MKCCEFGRRVLRACRDRVGFVLMLLFVLGLQAVFSVSAHATETAACTALGDPGTATLTASIQCMVDKVAPTGVFLTVVTIFVPLMLMLWGARGGLALCAAIVKRFFGFLTGRA